MQTRATAATGCGEWQIDQNMREDYKGVEGNFSEYNGCIHYFDCGVGFMRVYMSKIIMYSL